MNPVEQDLMFNSQLTLELCEMDFDFSYHDLESLKVLLEKESEELKAKLLSGASWEEVKSQRLRVTELSIALYKTLSPPSFNPAEFNQR